MSSVFEIGRAIVALCEPIVGKGKTFAVRAEADTRRPFVVYRRAGISDTEALAFDKDAGETEGATISIELDLFTDEYPKGIALISRIADAVEGIEWGVLVGGVSLFQGRVVDASEQVTEDGGVFVQSIDLKITI